MAATKRKSRYLTVSPSREAVKEEVVYYSFSLPTQFALKFFNHRVDANLADIEDDCKCSILVNSRRRRQQQQQQQRQHRSSAAATAAAASTAAAAAAAAAAASAEALDSTVEVLLDEAAGSFGRSVSRLSELVRGFGGGRLRIRRLIKKLSLADGSKKYRVEQPRRAKEALSPDSGTLDGSGTTAAEAASAATPASSSVVISFADEAEGHWSLYSLVSPFMDLAKPQQSRELARTLWIPAARLLADCTRSLVTEAVAGELISFSSYSRSGFDASLGDFVSTDGDSPMDDAVTDGGRNFSHGPKPGLTLLVTALLSSRAPPRRDDTIDNFVSSGSNSLNFTSERQAERLLPSFTEPLLLNKTTECRLRLHGAELKQRACAAVSTCCTNYAAPELSRACQSAAHTCRCLSQAACTSMPYRQSRHCGTLGESLACSGPPSSACQHTERLGQAAGSASQLGRLSETGAALPASRVMLTSGLVNCHAIGPASSQMGALGHSNSAGTPLRLPSSFQAVGHQCDRASLRAATACCEEAIPASAWKSTLTGECADTGRMASLLSASLRPGNSSVRGSRHPPLVATATGHSATCHTRARAAESVLAGCGRDTATAHVTVCQDAASARHQTVGLPRLLAADVAVTPSCRDERNAAAAFEASSASHHQLCKPDVCNAALAKRKHSAAGAEATARVAVCPDGRFEEPSEVVRAHRLKCPESGLHRARRCERDCAHLRVVRDESCARFESAGSEGLCQLAAHTAVKGFACSDCPMSAAALNPLFSSSNETTAFYNLTSATGGLLRSDSQRHSLAVDSLSPIECCDSVLPALAPTVGVRGISCVYQQVPSTSTSATYSLTFSQVTELSECSATGARRQCAGPRFVLDSAVFPRGCREPHAERAERCADAAPGSQTAETDWRTGQLTLPMIQLHGHGKDSCAVCVSNADCALLSLDELKSSPWSGLNEVMETSISLAAAATCDGACTGLIDGPAWCHHGQEAACQVRVFERDSGQLISGQCWHQLVDAIAGTAGALEWAVAWPAGRQSAAVLMEQTASMLAASAKRSRQKDAGTVSVPRGDVNQSSELVWESRRRIQLMPG